MLPGLTLRESLLFGERFAEAGCLCAARTHDGLSFYGSSFIIQPCWA